jgi:hypothetical protein
MNDPEFLFQRAFKLLYQKIDSKNQLIVFKLFSKAAHFNHVNAQFHLACCYEKGLGTKIDHTFAAYWFERAAINGHLHAQFNFATYSLMGWGILKNFNTAYNHYDISLSLYQSKINLSIFYYYGLGSIKKDIKQATTFYQEGIRQKTLLNQEMSVEKQLNVKQPVIKTLQLETAAPLIDTKVKQEVELKSARDRRSEILSTAGIEIQQAPVSFRQFRKYEPFSANSVPMPTTRLFSLKGNTPNKSS